MNWGAFTTVPSAGLAITLDNTCLVSEGFDPRLGSARPSVRQVLAQWDTGATNSVISERLAVDMGLIPMARAALYHANGSDVVNLYRINITIPGGIEFCCLTVFGSDLHRADLLIGMDIMIHGDFGVSHPGGRTKFTFQYPSTHDFDFLREMNTLMTQNH